MSVSLFVLFASLFLENDYFLGTAVIDDGRLNDIPGAYFNIVAIRFE